MSFLRSIARGPLWREIENSWRTSHWLEAALPPLGAAFISKGKIGRHFRAVSRNGMVLLIGAEQHAEISAARMRLRMSIWHRAHLPNEAAEPWGILLYAQRGEANGPAAIPAAGHRGLIASLDADHAPDSALSIELGGQRVLNFFSEKAQ